MNCYVLLTDFVNESAEMNLGIDEVEMTVGTVEERFRRALKIDTKRHDSYAVPVCVLTCLIYERMRNL